MSDFISRVEHAVAKIQSVTPEAFSFENAVALVLGSGLSGFTSQIKSAFSLAYSDIPGFPLPSVAGHSGRLVLGWIGETEQTPIVVMAGRIHYYEGLDLAEVTFPIRVLASLGIPVLLLTNAAGGIRYGFQPGDLMVITDHINLMGANPLRGSILPGLERFIDMSSVYSQRIRQAFTRAAISTQIALQSGVYVALSGPNYETPAEIRMLRLLGADAVGMSTVPEAIVARQYGMEIGALSCITNLAAGVSQTPLSHEEVIETTAKTATRIGDLLCAVIPMLASR